MLMLLTAIVWLHIFDSAVICFYCSLLSGGRSASLDITKKAQQQNIGLSNYCRQAKINM